jgi:hypothetical protein
MSHPFRHSAAFGKHIEFYVVGLMLKEGLDVYLPLVDDDAIDAVVKRPDGSFVEVQIKARSRNVVFGDAGLFAALSHEHRKNYWFIFFSERMETIWIMSSKEFLEEAHLNKSGKGVGRPDHDRESSSLCQSTPHYFTKQLQSHASPLCHSAVKKATAWMALQQKI